MPIKRKRDEIVSVDNRAHKRDNVDPVVTRKRKREDAVAVDESHRSVSSGRIKKSGSFLADDTDHMKREQRQMVQTVERQRYGKVHERDHEERLRASQEGDLQNDILNHPELDDQAHDGDPDVNPAPPLNTEARREYDKQLQLQNELKKQLDPNYAPKFNPSPLSGG